MADLLMKMPVPYEPKKKNRFIMRFDSSLGINEWYVESTSRPQITINAVEVPFLNTSTYVAGRFVWGTINVTFRDPIGPSAAQALMEWVRMHSESVTGRMGYAAGYKKNIEFFHKISTLSFPIKTLLTNQNPLSSNVHIPIKNNDQSTIFLSNPIFLANDCSIRLGYHQIYIIL